MKNITPGKQVVELVPEKKAVKKKAPAKKKTTAIAKKDDNVTALESYVKKRKSVMSFVKKEMREGIDYGEQYAGADKKSILIAGCEKVTNWLELKPKYFPDHGAWTMLGSADGVILFTCYLIWAKNIPLMDKKIKSFGVENEEMVYRMYAETTGKGGASMREKKIFDENVCIKKAKIRATKDAVLALGLHDEFGQDYELYEDDIESNGDKKYTEPKRKSATPTEAKGEKKEVVELRDAIVKTLRASKLPDAQRRKLYEKAEELLQNQNEIALEALKTSIDRQITGGEK
jgi:hypothetical protein